MTDRRCSGDDAGGSFLDQLQFVEGFMGETIEKGFAVFKTGGNQSVDQEGGAVGSKIYKEAANVGNVSL